MNYTKLVSASAFATLLLTVTPALAATTTPLATCVRDVFKTPTTAALPATPAKLDAMRHELTLQAIWECTTEWPALIPTVGPQHWQDPHKKFPRIGMNGIYDVYVYDCRKPPASLPNAPDGYTGDWGMVTITFVCNNK